MGARNLTEIDSKTIRVGISTCPNDTFAFHALINRKVDWRGLDFQIQLLDIQELNEKLFLGEFDVAKTSFHAALLLSDRTVVLPCGSALGFGVGPLLLAADADSIPQSANQLCLCPGRHTTAALLFQLFYPQTATVQHCVFSDIMPGLQAGTADFGVCIHEGRFTWQQAGIHFVEDLGTRWEAETGCPLPLGGLVARGDLSDDTIANVQAVVAESIQYSLADPDGALPTMRMYAQEFDDDVLMQHVRLYVNDWTVDLGDVGSDALNKLSEMAEKIGIANGQRKLSVWSG